MTQVRAYNFSRFLNAQGHLGAAIARLAALHSR